MPLSPEAGKPSATEGTEGLGDLRELTDLLRQADVCWTPVRQQSVVDRTPGSAPQRRLSSAASNRASCSILRACSSRWMAIGSAIRARSSCLSRISITRRYRR